MAITKETKIVKTEIVGDYKAIQIAEDIIYKEDGIETNKIRHRRVLHPSQMNYNTISKEKTHIDTDVSNEPQEIQDICNTVWTDEVKLSWKTLNEGRFK